MDDSKIFIIGAKGQLGLALQAQYPNAQSADIEELDITSVESVKNFDWSNYDVVLNAAAYTNVDGAETTEGRVASWKVNATAVSNLAGIMRENDITFVHISTDYVFDGTTDNHTESEDFAPLSVYGQSKAAGDIAVSLIPNHYILRTSWVIGEGNNFVRTMLGLADRGISPSVVADQVGRLTFTSELVRAIDHLLTTKSPYGTYNVSNDGESASWADITRTIFEMADKTDLTVTDTTTEEYYAGKEGIAPRPLKSTLDLTKLHATGFTSTNWKEALEAYIQKERA
jgi:dTDP-4-dehydrorhamnose 3,5-epimerase